MANADLKILSHTDRSYPPLLGEIAHPPHTLHYAGALPSANDTCVAVVGTRRATAYGTAAAGTIAEALARAGAIVVSGLAIGIDATAHRGALRGGGKTVAVLPAHPSIVYPRAHGGLAQEILARNGCLLSEYAPGEAVHASNFIARNRIISGLCRAVVIVEAPESSGALATARFALEQNRDVLVVPGPITAATFVGSHRLIRDGAALVASAEDVLQELGLAAGSDAHAADHPPIHDPVQRVIFALVRSAPTGVSIDNLVEQSKLQPHAVQEAVTFLALANRITEENGVCRSVI